MWLRTAGMTFAVLTSVASYVIGAVVAPHASDSALAVSAGGGTACGAAITAYFCGICEREHQSPNLLVFWRALADFGLVGGALWLGISGSVGATGVRSAAAVVPCVAAVWTVASIALAETAKRSA